MNQISKIEKVQIQFNRNVNHDPGEFTRQLKEQEKGLNDLTKWEYLDNKKRYIREGKSNKEQREFRKEILKEKITELRNQGMSKQEATAAAKKKRCFT